jgi:hypothetical protein
MKKLTKKIAATLMIGGMFIVPVFCFADTGENKSEDKSKTEVTTKKVVISQAELESIEEIKKLTEPTLKKSPKIRYRTDQMITQTVINDIEKIARIENIAVATLK